MRVLILGFLCCLLDNGSSAVFETLEQAESKFKSIFYAYYTMTKEAAQFCQNFDYYPIKIYSWYFREFSVISRCEKFPDIFQKLVRSNGRKKLIHCSEHLV